MVKAVLDRVFIRLRETPDNQKSSLVLTDDFAQDRCRGIVECTGPEVTSVKKGDDVLFHVFDELPTYDKNVVVVLESSLLGIFENEQNE